MDEHNLPRDGISREKEILDIKITKESGVESRHTTNIQGEATLICLHSSGSRIVPCDYACPHEHTLDLFSLFFVCFLLLYYHVTYDIVTLHHSI